MKRIALHDCELQPVVSDTWYTSIIKYNSILPAITNHWKKTGKSQDSSVLQNNLVSGQHPVNSSTLNKLLSFNTAGLKEQHGLGNSTISKSCQLWMFQSSQIFLLVLASTSYLFSKMSQAEALLHQIGYCLFNRLVSDCNRQHVSQFRSEKYIRSVEKNHKEGHIVRETCEHLSETLIIKEEYYRRTQREIISYPTYILTILLLVFIT